VFTLSFYGQIVVFFAGIVAILSKWRAGLGLYKIS